MDNLGNRNNSRPVTKGRIESGYASIIAGNRHSPALAIGEMNARSYRNNVRLGTRDGRRGRKHRLK